METGIDRDSALRKTLTGLIALPVYRKAERPSADALDKAVTWLKTNNRIPQTYSGYKSLIDTTFIQNIIQLLSNNN